MPQGYTESKFDYAKQLLMDCWMKRFTGQLIVAYSSGIVQTIQRKNIAPPRAFPIKSPKFEP